MVNIYKRFWHVNWAQQWQYRANLLMYLAYWIVSPITYLAVWSTIANQQGGVNGMSAADFAAYYLTLLPVDILTSCITIFYLATKVQDGTLSNDLVQPVHPVLTNLFVSHIAFKALQLMAFIPIWLVLGGLPGQPAHCGSSPLSWCRARRSNRMPLPSAPSNSTASPYARASTTGITTAVWATKGSPDSHSSTPSHQLRNPPIRPDYSARDGESTGRRGKMGSCRRLPRPRLV